MPASDVKLGARTVARSHPTAFKTAIASFAQDFGPIMSSDGTRDDRPIPRWSNRITRANEASRRWKRYIDGSPSTQSIGMNGPGNTSRSTGPSPKT